VNTDTQLTEAQVDTFVANNNYSTGTHTVVNGQAITPSSVTLSGTSTALTNGTLDLGPNTDDALTAAMVTTLTGGGAADSLHSHAAQAASSGPTTMSAESTSMMTFAPAVRHCRNLTEGGFTDWWLPTHDEIWTVYGLAAVPNDTSTNYVWTLTLAGSISYRLVVAQFDSGIHSISNGNNPNYVRCVR
jgi:hypothetical protein